MIIKEISKITYKVIKYAIKQRERYGCASPHYMTFLCNDGTLSYVSGDSAKDIYDKYKKTRK